MSYTLQAVVAPIEILLAVRIPGASAVRLTESLSMLPLTSAICRTHGIPVLPLTDEGNAVLPGDLSSRLVEASAGGRLAYVEAEYFGCVGTQACALYEDRNQIDAPLISASAINVALQFLGVAAREGLDEFDTVVLGAKRSTEQWC